MRSFRLKDYKWHGMLSIWGQEDSWYQAVCYSNLSHSPERSIKRIGKGEPPVTVFLIRYVDLPLAQWFFDYCINHIIHPDILKHCTFTRIHEKSMHVWPTKWKLKMTGNDILNPADFDYDYNSDEDMRAKVQEDVHRGPYQGCYPWMRIDFSQELSPMSMFAVSVLLRYVSEHGPTLVALKALDDMKFNINPEQMFSVANLLGGARGHAIGNFGYSYVESMPDFLRRSTWRKYFRTMETAHAPFYEEPKKTKDIDNYFRWESRKPQREELYTYNQNPELCYARNDVEIINNMSNMPAMFKYLEAL